MTTTQKNTVTQAPIPQGYKQTSVGIIPEDWEVKKLGEVSKIDKKS